MYTAMAAHRCGSQATLFAPRPDPCPPQLEPVANHLTEWLGPVVSPQDLPRFEISHRHGKTEYIKASFGAESTLSPMSLPADLSGYDHVHVTPLGDASKQLSFIEACRKRGAKQISAGTFLDVVTTQPQAAREIMRQTDFFFMNRPEARALFGSHEEATTEAGKVLYITLGPEGACIIQGDTPTLIPAVPSTGLDLTGAGDTFCGATLAYLLDNEHPVMAARRAMPLAAAMVAQIGPAALLGDDPPPNEAADRRVQVNQARVREVAAKIASIPEAASFQFVGPEFPSVGDASALDYFFTATLQQFGFWSEQDGRYHHPLLATMGGVERKGAFYLFEAFRRRAETDPDFFTPQRQAQLAEDELLEVFRADDGDDPMPALELHLDFAHSYGRDMLALQLTPQDVLQRARESAQPLQTFFHLLDKIGGYKEDPLRKKSGLLALILNQRPETFLSLRSDEQIAPVVDYHLMRSCLRIGLIEVKDEQLRDKLLNRLLVSPSEEWAVRHSSFRAMEKLIKLSGKSTGAVDWFFFGARKRCPEMSEPECEACQVDAVCAHRKELFQPVLRTSFY